MIGTLAKIDMCSEECAGTLWLHHETRVAHWKLRKGDLFRVSFLMYNHAFGLGAKRTFGPSLDTVTNFNDKILVLEKSY